MRLIDKPQVPALSAPEDLGSPGAERVNPNGARKGSGRAWWGWKNDRRGKKTVSANQYLDPTNAYASLVDRAEKGESRAWGIVRMLTVAVCTLSIVAMIGFGGRKVETQIYREMSNGEVVFLGDADAAMTPDEPAILSALGDWIKKARTITVDQTMMLDNFNDVYAFFDGGSQPNLYMNGLYASQDPFARAAKERVHVDVSFVTAKTPTSYEVEWVETPLDPHGTQLRAPQRWHTVITLEVRHGDVSVNAKQARANPWHINFTNIEPFTQKQV